MEAKTIEFQRWTAKRKAELILELIRGTKKIVDVCREQDLKQSEVEAWMETFLQGGEKCLKVNAEDEQAARAYPQRYPGVMMSRSAAWLASISVQLFANSFGDFIPSELCG